MDLLMKNVYFRVLAMTLTPIMAMLPAMLVGLVTLNMTTLYLQMNYGGIALALVIALVANINIFAKWGIKTSILGDLNLTGSYLRLVTYGVTFLVGLLPAGVAASVHNDAMNHILGIDLPAFGIAVMTSLGVNFSIFGLFGVKR